MSERKTLAAAAAITGASVPGFIVIFGLWGRAGLSGSAAADPAQVAAFAALHPGLYAALPVLGVVMHLAALLLVVGFAEGLERWSPLWGRAATALGMSWVFIDLLQNLMHYVLFMGRVGAPVAAAAGAAADAVWHAGHLGGGAWLVGLGLSGAVSPGRAFRLASAATGAAFFFHPFVVPLWPDYFGLELLLVPAWAFWAAVLTWRGPAVASERAAAGSRPAPA